MKNAFLIAALAFVLVIAFTLFSNSNDNAQIFSVILLILVFLVEKQIPSDNTMRRKKEDF
jgi:hypothetical protein